MRTANTALRLGLLVAGFATSSVFYSACQDVPDRFPCGKQLQGSEQVSVCDRPNEVCVCEVNRCAIRDPFCDESGLAYVFRLGDETESGSGSETSTGGNTGDEGRNCVGNDVAASAIDQLSRPEAARACPAVAIPECGDLDTNGELLTCGPNEVCSCSDFRCAEPFDQCSQKWRWPSTDVCLTEDARINLEASQANPLTGLCNGAGFPEMCGVPGIGGNPTTCPTGTTCICDETKCGTQNPGCDSGWAYANEFDVPEDRADACIPIPPDDDMGDGDPGDGDPGDGDPGDGDPGDGDPGDGDQEIFNMPDPDTGFCKGWK